MFNTNIKSGFITELLKIKHELKCDGSSEFFLFMGNANYFLATESMTYRLVVFCNIKR